MEEEYHSKQSVSNNQITNTKLYFNLGEVFSERPRNYLIEFHVFMAHFNTIPNLISEIKIDCVKAVKWFFENYKSDIKDRKVDVVDVFARG